MTKLNNYILGAYELACDELAQYFVTKYFGKGAEYYWIGNEPGGCIAVADRFFSMEDISDFIRHKYSAKMMFEYYDQKLACDMKDKEWRYNIKNYKKLIGKIIYDKNH
jgi:3-hydroxy-3-methylglutaryl CoA synthase